MLVLHPSSRCDVCLDTFNWDAGPEHAPHAIPCGHIFCKTCLGAMSPSNCPMCRKAFLPDRAKRLHVDRPEDTEDGRGVDLLQRLTLVWGDNTPEENVAEMTQEVEAWLETRPEDSNIPLRRARIALGKYQELKEKRTQDRATIRRLERTLEHRVASAEYDRQTSNAVEESLITQVGQLNEKLATAESEVEQLRSELARYQHTSNPLPAPPEPVALDRYPPFIQAATTMTNAAGANNLDLYPYTFPDQFAARQPSPEPPVRHSNRTPKGNRTRSRTPYNIYRPRDADAGPSSDMRNGIIPGAPATERVVPRPSVNGHMSASKNTSPRQAAGMASWFRSVSDPAAPASAYVSGYSSGYNQGYDSYAQVYPAYQEPPPETPPPELRTAPEPEPEPQPSIDREYGLANFGSMLASLPTPHTVDAGSYDFPSRESPDEAVGLALVGISPPGPVSRYASFSGRHTERPRDVASERRQSTRTHSGVDPNVLHTALNAARASGQAPRAYTRGRTLSTQAVVSYVPPSNRLGGGEAGADAQSAASSHRGSTASYSTWGTLSSASRGNQPRDSLQSSMQGSVSDLRLISFPAMPTQAGSSASSVTGVSQSSMAIAPASFYATEPLPNRASGSASTRVVLVGQDEAHAVPQVPGAWQAAPTTGGWQTAPLQEERRPSAHRTSRSSRHRDAPRRLTTMRTPLTAAPLTPATHYVAAEGEHAAPSASTSESVNALGLLDLAQHGATSGGAIPISAPTPIVSSRHFLRSFSYDSSR